jgi:hypothetical protein
MSRPHRTHTGLWTEAFERLHHAAPIQEVEQLAAAELAELLADEDTYHAATGGPPR